MELFSRLVKIVEKVKNRNLVKKLICEKKINAANYKSL